MSRPSFIAPAIVSGEVFVPLHHLHSFITLAGREEVRAGDVLRPLRDAGHDVDVDRRGIGEQHRARLHHRVELREHLLLDVHALEHRLDDDVGVGDLLVALAPAGCSGSRSSICACVRLPRLTLTA